MLLPQLVGRAGASRIIRLEKSIQIGGPVEEVFAAWVDWERLPRVTDKITAIRNHGDRTQWRASIGGREIEWEAITEQYIENQAIGWKSVRGPKHTGRVTFSPIENDCIVHVTMNYAPPARALRPILAPMNGHMEGIIEKVLRDFKASVESRPRGAQGSAANRGSSGLRVSEASRTGTYGDEPIHPETRWGVNTPLGSGNPSDAKR